MTVKIGTKTRAPVSSIRLDLLLLVLAGVGQLAQETTTSHEILKAMKSTMSMEPQQEQQQHWRPRRQQEIVLTDDWNFNRQMKFHLPVEDPNTTVQVTFQCKGAEYQNFANRMVNYTNYLRESGQKPLTWGHRAQPLPSNSQILFFGNSHMRQVAFSVLGQFYDVKDKNNSSPFTDMYLYGLSDASQISAQRYRIAPLNITVYLAVNSYLEQCPFPHWKTVMEEQIGATLDSMDAIVMGVLNPYQHQYRNAAKEYYDSKENGVARLGLKERFGCYLELPQEEQASLAQMLQLVQPDRPVVYMSMFGDQHHHVVEEAQRHVEELRNQSKVFSPTTIIRTRKYVKGIGHEGAKISQYVPGPCKPHMKNAHRCAGPLGGHPDLVAWDISEFIYEHLVQ